jgi:hypothetical protein
VKPELSDLNGGDRLSRMRLWVDVVRTGPSSARPEHDLHQFERLCRVGAFQYLTASGCPRLDEAYMAASHRGDF